MLPTFLSLPVLTLLMMVQTAVVSRMPLLHGTADLVLLAIVAWSINDRVKSAIPWAVAGGLLMGYISGLPFGVYLGGYLATALIALLMRRIVWKIPFLAMLVMTFTGTLIVQGASMVALTFSGTSLPILDSLSLIVLPSLLLNLLLAVPFYIFIGDFAHWLYPLEIEA